MNLEYSDEIDSVLEHTTTLRVYLYLRYYFEKSSESIGIRETQTALKMKSPSIAKWHLEKLEVAGIVEKLSSNRYILTEVGLNLKQRIPVKISTQLVKGSYIPRLVLLLAFLVISCIITIAFSFWNPTAGAINGILSLIILLYFLIRHYMTIRKDMQVYDLISED